MHDVQHTCSAQCWNADVVWATAPPDCLLTCVLCDPCASRVVTCNPCCWHVGTCGALRCATNKVCSSAHYSPGLTCLVTRWQAAGNSIRERHIDQSLLHNRRLQAAGRVVIPSVIAFMSYSLEQNKPCSRTDPEQRKSIYIDAPAECKLCQNAEQSSIELMADLLLHLSPGKVLSISKMIVTCKASMFLLAAIRALQGHPHCAATAFFSSLMHRALKPDDWNIS